MVSIKEITEVKFSFSLNSAIPKHLVNASRALGILLTVSNIETEDWYSVRKEIYSSHSFSSNIMILPC